MSRSRAVCLALSCILLQAVAREADRALGLLLRAEILPAGLVRELARAFAADFGSGGLRVVAWTAAGLALWLALALRRARAERLSLAAGAAAGAASLTPLLLKPALSLLALASVAARGSWPYAFTLPVALTQDWSAGVDAAICATLAASSCAAPRWPAPRARGVVFLAFLGYAVLVPDWAWQWEGHPGNEPKYLRQATALGLLGTFDAEGVGAPMEELPARPLGESLTSAVAEIARESGRMVVALARGEAGREAIRATRITRQTIRGKEGGVFYVLAPGPSLLLAPALRVDRAINRARGTTGRVALGVLVWCALAALLVGAQFQLVRDATGSAALAAAAAFGFALLPPFLFYFFQFYPELIGALVLAVAFRVLALRRDALARHPWWFGALLATLPWLHQKFLPVWLVLAATAAWLLMRRGSPREDEAVVAHRARRVAVVALVVTQLLSASLLALYNFAITGSVRPDALFLAWGPGGVSSARVGQGLLGLLLDARYGVLPYVPLLALAGAGLARAGARRFAVVWPSAIAYYATVASADNWAGAVCNLGRYFMPVAPLAVALVAIAVADASSWEDDGRRRGAAALGLVLAAWSALFALALWQDPLAANDSGLLLAKSSYADAHQYVPDLFIRHWSEAAPGLWARIAAWAGGVALLALALRRVSSPVRALAALSLVLLAIGAGLERWPSRRPGPTFANALPLAADGRVFFEGAVRVTADEAILGPGRVELLVRRSAVAPAADPLRVTLGGSGALRANARALVLRPTGALVDLEPVPYHVVRGADGRVAAFSRLGLDVAGQALLRFGADGATLAAPVGPPAALAEPGEDVEPGAPGMR